MRAAGPSPRAASIPGIPRRCRSDPAACAGSPSPPAARPWSTSPSGRYHPAGPDPVRRHTAAPARLRSWVLAGGRRWIWPGWSAGHGDRGRQPPLGPAKAAWSLQMPVFAVMAPRLELSLETDGVDAVVGVDFAGGGVSPGHVEPTITGVRAAVSAHACVTLT